MKEKQTVRANPLKAYKVVNMISSERKVIILKAPQKIFLGG